jgi:serine/threonine protein kinase
MLSSSETSKTSKTSKTSVTLTDDDGRQFRKSSKRLGEGTFAEVFLGEWLNPPPAQRSKTSKRTLVAIKQFYLSKQTLDKALETEIDIMREMKHPRILRLITVVFMRASPEVDDDEDDEDDVFFLPPEDRLWIVLEYCGGGDFGKFIKGHRLSEKWS